MPYILNPQEANYVSRIPFLVTNFLNPKIQEVPGFFLYLNSIIAFIASGSLSLESFLSQLEFNPGSVYLPLRFLSILFGVGSVVVVYCIGGLFNTVCGLLGAAFLAVSFLHVKYSQIFLPASGLVFFSLMSSLFTLKAYLHKDLKLLKVSTIFVLLSACMHYLGAVNIVGIFFVLCLQKELSKFKSLLVFFTGGYFILNPYCVFSFFRFVQAFFQSYQQRYCEYGLSTYLLYLFDFLLYGIGPVIWVSALSLIKYKDNYDKNLLILLFSVPFFYFALAGFLHLTNASYAAFLAPYFCLAGALTINSFFTELHFTFILLILFAFYIPLKYTFKHNKLLCLSDTRIIATEWIKSNTTKGFKVVWDKNSVQPNWHDVYDKEILKRLVEDQETLEDKLRLTVDSKLLTKKSWLKILRRTADYVVINSLDYEWVLRQKGDKLQGNFYKTILKREPEIVFNPYFLDKESHLRGSLFEDLYSPFETLWQRERTGPVIKIYKL